MFLMYSMKVSQEVIFYYFLFMIQPLLPQSCLNQPSAQTENESKINRVCVEE